MNRSEEKMKNEKTNQLYLSHILLLFQDQVLGFLMDIFSFHKSNYTTVEALAGDILYHVKTRVENLTIKLSKNLQSLE